MVIAFAVFPKIGAISLGFRPMAERRTAASVGCSPFTKFIANNFSVIPSFFDVP